MIIRDATPGDAAVACSVLRRSITELCTADHGNDPAILAAWLANKTPEIVHSWIVQPGGSILVAIEGDRILGVAGVTDKGEITLNYVSPDERFRGVSRALLRAVEARARERGSSRCTLISSETAHRFYLSAGYADVGTPQGKYRTTGSHPMAKALYTGEPTIRPLAPADRGEVEAFLAKHPATSMFLRCNLRTAGLEDRGERYQASYLGAFRQDELTGLIAHCWNGMILPQAPQSDDLLELTRAVLKLPSTASRGFTGTSGDNRQVSAVRTLFDVDQSVVQLDRAESLFSLDLADLRVPPNLAQADVTCRRATASDSSELLTWRLAYDAEALAREDNDAKADETAAWLRDQIQRGDVFVLQDKRSGRPLATSAFNASLPDMVQIGAVYTPPPLRGRGYARAVVAGQLQIAHAEGVKAALLFSDATAAIRAYEAIGFRRIGAFRLVLLKRPWFPAAAR